MSPHALLALQFLQACIGSAIAGLAVWTALRAALARWPELAMQRWAWLLPQLMVVLVFALLLAPQSSQLSLMPEIALEQSVQTPVPAPSSAGADVDGGTDEATMASASSGEWLVPLAQAWLLVYLGGLGLAIAKTQRAMRVLRALRRSASPLPALDGHAGFAPLPPGARQLAVYETDAAISPMLIGVRKPWLLLPRHLRAFEHAQQQMVIAHELTHLRRRDPLWMAVSIVLQTLLWFNPVMRKLGDRLTWAQELSCDQQVLAGRSQPQRQAYAAALLAQLKLQQDCLHGAMAFGGQSPNTLAARMQLIRRSSAPTLSLLARSSVIGAIAAALAGTLLLQPAFGRPAPAVPQASPVAIEATLAWQAPLAHPRVSSFYGVTSAARTRAHRGIDFAAPTGTPVYAGADGTVSASTDLYNGEAIYGKTIRIDHAGAMQSLYAHLDVRHVAVGDKVKAGQLIGLSGATGKVSGPHLHFEVWQGGGVINPETVIDGLAMNATRAALRARLPAP
jgi:murein DD-endopeptidase MepM/ murein hydrolase activator NlpD